MFRVARRVLAGIRALFRRVQAERDLDEELAAYLDAAVERHVRAGLSREAATRAARIELGSATAVRQQVHEAGWESHLDAWSLSLRDAWRGLRRAPGFALIAVGTLSMGIGGTTVMFSAVDGVYPTMYVPSLARPGTNLLVRSAGRPPAELAPAVQAAIASLDKTLAPGVVQPLDRLLDDSIARPRFNAVLLNGFAVLALIIALAGIYGLVSFSVNERTREIGPRLALGATRGTIHTMFLRSGLRLAAIGAALGMIGSVALSRVIRGVLFNVQPADPATYATIGALLGVSVLAACWLPARRASILSPLSAVRGDRTLSR